MVDNARSIWTSVLQRLAATDFLAPHSFRIGSMGVDEIIHACTRPLRMQRTVQSRSSLTSTAVQFELLTTPTTPADGLLGGIRWLRNEDIHQTFLCPGGRWLIGTAGDADKSHLGVLCWDLSQLPVVSATTSGDESPVLPRLAPIAHATCRGDWNGHAPHLRCFSGPMFSESVIIALQYSVQTPECAHEVMKLVWNKDSDTPEFVAQVHGFTKVPDPFRREMSTCDIQADGELICIRREDGSVVLWNWGTGATLSVGLGNPIAVRPRLVRRTNLDPQFSIWLHNNTIITLSASQAPNAPLDPSAPLPPAPAASSIFPYPAWFPGRKHQHPQWLARIYRLPPPDELATYREAFLPVHAEVAVPIPAHCAHWSFRFRRSVAVSGWVLPSDRYRARGTGDGGAEEYYYTILTVPAGQFVIQDTVVAVNSETGVPRWAGVQRSGGSMMPFLLSDNDSFPSTPQISDREWDLSSGLSSLALASTPEIQPGPKMLSIRGWLTSHSDGTRMHADLHLLKLLSPSELVANTLEASRMGIGANFVVPQNGYAAELRTELSISEWGDAHAEGHNRGSVVEDAFCTRSGRVVVSQWREGVCAFALLSIP